MPRLDVRRTYADGFNLLKQDLDAFVDDIETLFNITKLNDDNFQDAGITANTKLIDSAITTVKLANSTITTAKIADSAVTTAKIADSNVTTDKIADSNITTAKIADSNVTTAKINDLAVTNEKLEALTPTTGNNAGGSTVLTTSFTALGNSSQKTVSSSGFPVIVSISGPSTATGTAAYNVIGLTISSAYAFSQATAVVRIARRPSISSTWSTVAEYTFIIAHRGSGVYPDETLLIPASALSVIDQPGAGTWVYEIQGKYTALNNVASVTATLSARLIILEIGK